MGMNSDGILVYGYDLGGTDGGYNFLNLNPDDEPDVPWWLSDDDNFDWGEAMDNMLLEAIGFTETDWQVDGYWERKRKAQSKLDVAIHSYGSYDFGGYLMTAWHDEATWGEVKSVNFEELNLQRLEKDWDGRLDWAMKTLGLVPKENHAQWLLASFYG